MPKIPEAKIAELKAANEGKALHLIFSGDGAHEIVVKCPDWETWKRYRMAVRSDDKNILADLNFVGDCLVYPTRQEWVDLSHEQPALPNVFAVRLQEIAGTEGTAGKKVL